MFGALGAHPAAETSSRAVANSHASLTGAPNFPASDARRGGTVLCATAYALRHISKVGKVPQAASWPGDRRPRAGVPPAARSIGAPLTEDDRHGSQHDPQIEPDRPVVNVIEVVADAGA